MGLKIEDDLPKVKWAEYARLKNKIDPREVVPALPNKYFPIVVRAASRDELDDIPRDLYTVTVLATVKRPDLEEALVIALTRIDECQDSFKSLLLNIHDIVRKSGGGDEPPGNLFFAPIDEGKLADCIIGVMRGFFHDEETCNICDKEYNRMEFCVLMHILIYVSYIRYNGGLGYMTTKEGSSSALLAFTDKNLCPAFKKSRRILPAAGIPAALAVDSPIGEVAGFQGGG